MITHVTVAWDGSPASEAALDWAVARETHRTEAVRIVTIHAPNRRRRESEHPDTVVDTERRLHARIALLERAHPTFYIDGIVAIGDVVDELRGMTGPDVLLVLGQDHGRDGGDHVHRRGTPARLCVLGTGPIAIVPHPGETASDRRADERRTILVGVDGTNVSLDALRFAALEALSTRARLVAAHIWTSPERWDDAHVRSEPIEGLMKHQHERLLEESIEVGLAELPDVDVVRRVIRGQPARELRRLARQADLIVVGDHARGDLARRFLGSVSLDLAVAPPIPTVVVRHGGDSAPRASSSGRRRVDA
ncbi:nucleotide-binding universal stress UspA family protein [Clavibacter michiganensis]|uniref:universal stress protein n=1 Tax=Clavibacter michiganensis TaxID=28447 RepID=UPI001AE21A68|nr:universal stress protein [Clavibacter michiganensis]MBP2458395.1 nucleotide-binding universal stress UspA family protein [Clavibacter michiganensis]MDQ0410966.1 nucleotide-binding universal stress UspA family protein [Clavibacter michiganensis]